MYIVYQYISIELRTSSFISNLREADSLINEQTFPQELLSAGNTSDRNLLTEYSSTPSLRIKDYIKRRAI